MWVARYRTALLEAPHEPTHLAGKHLGAPGSRPAYTIKEIYLPLSAQTWHRDQLKLSTRRPSSGRCRPQTTSASNDVPRLAAPLLRPTTCPTPSRGRKEEARATTSGTRGRRACGGTTSRTNRTSAERRVSRAPAAATPTPSAADGGRESTRRGATRPSPSRLPPAAPRGVGCTALRDGPGGGERPLPPAWRTISPVEASL